MIINEIFQFIGTLASIIGLTYAFYLTKNNQRQNIEKAKEKIIEKLFFLIGDNNEFDSIEVLAVINSVFRQYKIKEHTVLPSEIVEDYISTIISNPLLSSSNKNKINDKLKIVLNEFMIAQEFMNLDSEKRNKIIENSMNNNNGNIKILLDNDILNKAEYEKSKTKLKIYDILVIIIFSFVFLLYVFILVFFPENKNDYVNINFIIVLISLIPIIFIIYDNIRKQKKK